mgnify:CR=1 FL=1
MDNSIAAILEIDRKARETSGAAAKKAEEILEAARAEKESLTRETERAVNEQTEKKLAELKAAADKETADIESAAEEKCRSLDEKMAAGRDGFRSEIVGRILTVG